jgi:hypothetical protein
MQRSTILSLDEIFSTWLPLRMQALNDAAWALELQTRTFGSEEISLSIGSNLNYKGYAGNFLQPIYQVGFVHARALLEFIGLQGKNGQLTAVKKRRSGDIAIENYSANGSPLEKVSPEEICAFINMPDQVVEWALVNIIEITNKSLAHVTTGEILTMAMHGQIWCALAELPQVIETFFYEKLPDVSHIQFDFLSWRKADGSKIT